MNKIELKIEVINDKVSLSLWDKSGEMFDEISTKENRKISTELLPNLDFILRRNKLKLNSINSINFQSNISSNFTSNRIAQIIKNILLWSKEDIFENKSSGEVSGSCG